MIGSCLFYFFSCDAEPILGTRLLIILQYALFAESLALSNDTLLFRIRTCFWLIIRR